MDVEELVHKYERLIPAGAYTLGEGIRAALTEQAETHAIELRAYEATVENLEQRLNKIQSDDLMAECMEQIRNDLIAAGVIDKTCAPMFLADAVISRVRNLEQKDYTGGDAELLRERIRQLEAEREAIERGDELAPPIVGFIAEICHEANRAYCKALGDDSQLPWAEAPDWQRASAIKGVEFHIANPGAGQSHSHDSWLEQKRAEGWKYGPVKDAEKKEHPCFVPYDQLPPEQKAKDYIFAGIVKSISAFTTPDLLLQRTTVANQAERIRQLEAERVPDAFDLGFHWRAALDGHVHDARDVARTLTCDFWPDSIKAARIQPDMTKGKVEAITFAKAEIKRLLAAAPQPKKEGE